MTAQAEPAGALTSIVGIGPQTASKLRHAGIRTVDQLAHATVEQIVAAEGRNLAPSRAQSWVKQAIGLSKSTAAGTASAASSPPPSRRTFTVEVRVDGDPAHVVTTRVVQLETQEADGWSGWDRARLLEFMEARIGVTDSGSRGDVAEPAGAEPAAASAADAAPVASTSTPLVDGNGGGGAASQLKLYRYDLLRARTPVMRGGKAAARLRIDPADLDLPAQGGAVAEVELLARPLGAGREQVVDTRVIDLSARHAIDTLLGYQLPDQDPPFAVAATVRILVDQPVGRPKAGLGSAVLEVATEAGSM